MNEIRARIQHIEHLPTFPCVAGEVMRLVRDPGSSASDVVRHMDPSCVTEVLKAANCVHSGRKGSRRIGNMEQAVVADRKSVV
jgi:HD-like signal output (HDOD) protein